jgi:putative tricarboxylic transport membrane protein
LRLFGKKIIEDFTYSLPKLDKEFLCRPVRVTKMQKERSKLRKDYYAGGLMTLLGLAAAFQGATYKIGTLSHMGPGFFPVVLGIILALTGVAIAGSAAFVTATGTQQQLLPEWRGSACISLSIVAFIILGKYLGLLAATIAIVFISALGDRENRLVSAFVLALGMLAVCVIVFWWALQIQFPLFARY